MSAIDWAADPFAADDPSARAATSLALADQLLAAVESDRRAGRRSHDPEPRCRRCHDSGLLGPDRYGNYDPCPDCEADEPAPTAPRPQPVRARTLRIGDVVRRAGHGQRPTFTVINVWRADRQVQLRPVDGVHTFTVRFSELRQYRSVAQ